jgi:NADPH:quinone reductase-like Zn-dependent oxidoreductase
MKAVRLDDYGDIDVLYVTEVERPEPGPGQVLVAVRAAGLNLGEAKVRQGMLREVFPSTFPSGQGSDFAGVVEAVGSDVDTALIGQDVAGWTDERASHAEFVVAPSTQVVPKPGNVAWEVAGSLFVIGSTAYAAVAAVDPHDGEVLLVSGAAGGVGSLVSQLALARGARVVGVAKESDHEWLRSLGVDPVAYGDGVADRIRAKAQRLDALVDTAGHGYVALGIELGISPDRIDTVVDFPAVAQYGVKSDGSAAGSSAEVLAALLDLVSQGRLDIPIDRTFELSDVRAAYEHLEGGHGRGKVVFVM